MSSIILHPAELAYAFSYTRTEEVIGWGDTPMKRPEDTDEATWLEIGATRLLEAGRLVGDEGEAMNFNDDITSVVMALADPTIVLLCERKVDDGLRRMSVHGRDKDFIGMMRRADGLIEISRYEELTAAAAASAAFLGASLTAADADTRFTSKKELFYKLYDYASEGRTAPVVAALVKLGLSDEEAASAASAFAKPTAQGMLSVFFCADNVAQDAEVFSILTNANDQSWLLSQSGDDQMTLARSSVADMAARATVSIGVHMASAA